MPSPLPPAGWQTGRDGKETMTQVAEGDDDETAGRQWTMVLQTPGIFLYILHIFIHLLTLIYDYSIQNGMTTTQHHYHHHQSWWRHLMSPCHHKSPSMATSIKRVQGRGRNGGRRQGQRIKRGLRCRCLRLEPQVSFIYLFFIILLAIIIYQYTTCMAPSPPSLPPSTKAANGRNTHDKDNNWGCAGITPQAMLMGWWYYARILDGMLLKVKIGPNIKALKWESAVRTAMSSPQTLAIWLGSTKITERSPKIWKTKLYLLRLQTIKAIVDSHSFKSPKSDEPRRVQVLDLYCLTRFECEGSSKGIVY